MTNDEVITKSREQIHLRGLSPWTETEYVGKLKVFIRYFKNRPLEEMGETEIRDFLLYQLNLGKSSGTLNVYNSTLRFIFGAVLERNLNYKMIPRRRIHRELPSVMSRTEIVKFFSVINNLRDRAIFETVYGVGLRLSQSAATASQPAVPASCSLGSYMPRHIDHPNMTGDGRKPLKKSCPEPFY